MAMQWSWIVAMIGTVLILVQGQPQYEVQVRGHINFEYRPEFVNKLADRRCCSLAEAGTSCLISCENRIILCFREIQHLTNDTNSADCPLGRMIFTPPTMNTDIITFNATMTATTTTYPGIFQLLVNIIALPGGNKVESRRLSLVEPIQYRDSQLTSQNFGFDRTQLRTGGIRVVCKEGYFGPDCGCTPRDDSTGHLTCDEDGTIMCLPGYQNTTTNCVEEEGATPQPTTNTGTISEPTTVFTVGATITSSIDSTMMTVTSTGKTTLRIQPSSTYGNTKPMSTTGASSNTGRKIEGVTIGTTGDSGTITEPQSVLPIAVGGAVGGLVVLLIIIILIIIFLLLIFKGKRKKKIDRDEATTAMICLEGLPNSNNNTDGIDDAEMYTSINKESKQEEAPPIVPYEGEIYSGVEKTGLFPTNTTSTSTPTTGEDEEPRYHTTQFNGVSKTVTGISDEPQYSIARAVHSSKEQFNEEPLYDTTFTKIAPSEQEPHYSTTIRNVPKTATAQISETSYSVLNSGSNAQNIGPENSKLEATTHYQNQAELQTTQNERHYSELETTKKPNDQTEVPDYSILENEEPGFSEVESEIKQPEYAYADLDICSRKNNMATKTSENDTETAEVHYSYIKNVQSS